MKLIINSLSKINFGLFITEKRSDGFHNIETIFYPLRLSDEIIIRECDHLLIECSVAELNSDPTNNLIYKAVKLLEQKTGKPLNCRITLNKNIPLGAGLGGGSSNAASVLLGLNDLFNLGYSKVELSEFGLQLGSDVPFFIHPYPSFASGRGEKLSEIDLKLEGFIVVVNPGIHVSTAEAYKNCKPSKPGFNLLELNGRIINNYNELRGVIVNTFETTVFETHPQISELKESMLRGGASFSLMSGSGSTVFGIFETEESAEVFINSLPPEYLVYTEEL
jgi:4-diphosphocytidyl-2-C-methyl-D-erythritol kinase